MRLLNSISRWFDKLFIKARTDRNFSGSVLFVAVIAVFLMLGVVLGSMDTGSGLSEDGQTLTHFEPTIEEYFELYNQTATTKKASTIGSYNPTAYYLTNSGHYAYTARAGECSLELITDTSGKLVEITLFVASDSDVTALLRNTVNAANVIDEGLSKQISKSFKDLYTDKEIEYEEIICELSIGRNIVFEIYPKWLGSYKSYGSTTFSDEDSEAVCRLLGEVSAALYYEAEFRDFSDEEQNSLACAAVLRHIAANPRNYGLSSAEDGYYFLKTTVAEIILDDMFVFHGEPEDVFDELSKKKGAYLIPADNTAAVAEITILSAESCGISHKYPSASFVVEFKAQYDGIVGQGSAIVSRDSKGIFGFSIYSLSFTQI